MISLVIINYNSEKLLKTCLDSIRALTYADREVIFIDNASADWSVEYVRAHYPEVRIIANYENLGYAGGANQAVRKSKGEFVVILNPDIVFEPDYFDVLVERMERDKKIGAIIGKLRKFDFAKGEKTNVIDSAGLLMYKSRRCVDRGQGEEDRGQYDTAEEVFGITGAVPMYRRAALEDVAVGSAVTADGTGGSAGAAPPWRGAGVDEYFDESFFMYKEDVDISWRLRLAGWKCFYEPRARAYHGRGTGAVNRATMVDVARARGGLSRFQKHYSYKNERLMRAKNELSLNVAHDFVHIAWREMLMTGWMCVREPYLFKSFFVFLKQLPGALTKRHAIMQRKKASAKEMQKWFS